MIKIAFCNDCDSMTWKTYKTIHRICDDLGLPAGDSFMLFNPSHTQDICLWGGGSVTKPRITTKSFLKL